MQMFLNQSLNRLAEPMLEEVRWAFNQISNGKSAGRNDFQIELL